MEIGGSAGTVLIEEHTNAVAYYRVTFTKRGKSVRHTFDMNRRWLKRFGRETF